ncbi:MAG: acyl carrier protein [Bryobacteraceae bacterium]
MSTLERVCSLAADVFGVQPGSLGPESTPESVETWDSIQHLNLILAFEQEFGVQFEPDEIEQLVSIEKMVSVLDQKLAETGAVRCQ